MEPSRLLYQWQSFIESTRDWAEDVAFIMANGTGVTKCSNSFHID
jgi:hypothetical protein